MDMKYSLTSKCLKNWSNLNPADRGNMKGIVSSIMVLVAGVLPLQLLLPTHSSQAQSIRVSYMTVGNPESDA